MTMRNQTPPPFTEESKMAFLLNRGRNTLWQAHALIETIQQAYEDEEHITLNSALNGVLALMSSGLDDLGEL